MFTNKTLWLNNLKTRTAMNAKTSVFLLLVLKRSYICYYIICMTVPKRPWCICKIQPTISYNSNCRKSLTNCKKLRKHPPEVFCKKGVLINFAKFIGKHMWQTLFFRNFIKKETLAQVFSCKFCETSKNTFFTEHLQVTASEIVAEYSIVHNS